MTESPGPQARPSSEPTSAAETPSRWDRQWGNRRPGGIFRLAAFVVIAAGIVFIFAVVFWTGLIIGAHLGGHEGHHHWHHDGHQSSMMQNGPSTTPAAPTSQPARP
jgi:hypothetical protein